MREIYTPVFDGFFEGSIMLEEVETRFLFLVMLRLALRPGADGVVDLPLSRLAAIAAMPEEAVRRALDALMRPDPLSGSDTEEGRRLVLVKPGRPERGWRVVNVHHYREAVHRINDAARKKRERAEAGKKPPRPPKKKPPGKDKADASVNVPERPGASVNGATRRDDTRRSDTRREEKKERGPSRPHSFFSPPTVEDVRREVAEKGYTFNPERFVAVNESKGWKGVRDWKAVAKAWQLIERSAPEPETDRKVAYSLAEVCELTEAQEKKVREDKEWLDRQRKAPIHGGIGSEK